MQLRKLSSTPALSGVLALALNGCGDDVATTAKTEPTEDSAKTKPDYVSAFPQERVTRLDIKIAQENWQAMLDDMTSMLGEFGATGTAVNGSGPTGSSGAGTAPEMTMPQEMIDACVGKVAADGCSASFMGTAVDGTCVSNERVGLACQPSGGMAPGGTGGAPTGGANFDLVSRDPIYVECEVTDGSTMLYHVGVRFKGNSSLAMSWMQGIWKLPLRLKFDEYEDLYPEILDQRFYGFKALGLSNGSADPTLLRDKLGTEVFANAGLPAPATAFYRIYIDHGEGPTYFGLYTGIEIPSDNAFLEARFGSHRGNLYKPSGTGAQWNTWDEATLGKENNEEAADYSDAHALFDALHADRSDPVSWRIGLERHLDVDGFLHWLALNTVIEDWDTYGSMAHNYYLYADPGRNGRFAWIAWDHSYAFNSQSALSLGMTEVTDQWPLIRFLLDDAEYLATYRSYVELAAAEEYAPDWVSERFREAHDLIAPYVVGIDGELTGSTFVTSPSDFEASVDSFVNHAITRQNDVAAYLAK
jgi:hypothetical protein